MAPPRKTERRVPALLEGGRTATRKSKAQPRRPQSAKLRFRTSDYGPLFYDGVNRHPYRRKFNHAEVEVVKRPTAAWKYASAGAKEEVEDTEAEEEGKGPVRQEQQREKQQLQQSKDDRAPIQKRPSERIASHYTRDAEWLGSPRRVYSSVWSTSQRPPTLQLVSPVVARQPKANANNDSIFTPTPGVCKTVENTDRIWRHQSRWACHGH